MSPTPYSMLREAAAAVCLFYSVSFLFPACCALPLVGASQYKNISHNSEGSDSFFQDFDQFFPYSHYYKSVPLQESDSCPGCATQEDDFLTNELRDIFIEKELRKFRLKLAKEQILSRLKLKEPPNWSWDKTKIPLLVREGKIPGLYIDEDPYLKSESTSTRILLSESRIACTSIVTQPSSCFRFRITKRNSQQSRVVLWVWKSADGNDQFPQLITVSQIWSENKPYHHQQLLIAHNVTNVSEGWVPLELQWQSVYSLATNEPLDLMVTCATCITRERSSPFFGEWPSQRPFIVTISQMINAEVKTKRSTNDCSSKNARKECCRDSIFVDFSEIGFKSILYPRGFMMYFCRGSCEPIDPFNRNNLENSYSSLLQRFAMSTTLSKDTRAAITPCCSAKHKDDLTIIHLPSPRSNEVKIDKLPDMIVRSCDCLG